jgi:CheY-like chemotaxis protein
MNGFDVLSHLTADPTNKVAVVVVTAHDSPESQQRVLDGGAAAYFRKPVDAKPTGQRADAETLHKVYSTMLGELSLSESHRRDLLRRKAPLPFGERGYKSLPRSGRGRTIAKMREKFSDDVLLTVPGFVRKIGKEQKPYLTILGMAGLIVKSKPNVQKPAMSSLHSSYGNASNIA